MLCCINWLHLMALRIAKQLPPGWLLITPGSHMAFLSSFTHGWPQMTLARLLTPSMHYTLVWGDFYQIWRPQGISWGIWTLVDPGWPMHDLWPQQCTMLWSWILPTKFGGHRALLSKLTPDWPQLTLSWPLTPAMHYTLVRDSSHQIWWPQGISKQFDPWLTLDDPCMIFGPQRCITLWSGVLPIKFGGHRALLSRLTPTWPQLTPSWPLTLALHYALVRDSSHQIWWP